VTSSDKIRNQNCCSAFSGPRCEILTQPAPQPRLSVTAHNGARNVRRTLPLLLWPAVHSRLAEGEIFDPRRGRTRLYEWLWSAWAWGEAVQADQATAVPKGDLTFGQTRHISCRMTQWRDRGQSVRTLHARAHGYFTIGDRGDRRREEHKHEKANKRYEGWRAKGYVARS
jgi:hypothetical protein